MCSELSQRINCFLCVFQDMVAYRGGGTYARNPSSSAQGGEEEDEDEGEDEEEEEDDDE